MSEPLEYAERSWSEEPIPIYVGKADNLPHEPPLTEDEVEVLPDGAQIIVYWGGGNGPHRYEVEREDDGTLWALSRPRGEWGARGQDPMWPSYLTSYGTERWQSKVWLSR